MVTDHPVTGGGHKSTWEKTFGKLQVTDKTQIICLGSRIEANTYPNVRVGTGN